MSETGSSAGSNNSVVTASLTNADQIKSRIEELKRQLQTQSPGYESLLHTIHRNLATDPDVVQILTEEEIGIICAGLSKRTGVFIAVETMKKESKGKGKKVSLNDL